MSKLICKLLPFENNDIREPFLYVKVYTGSNAHVVEPLEWAMYAKEYLNCYDFIDNEIYEVIKYRGPMAALTYKAH